MSQEIKGNSKNPNPDDFRESIGTMDNKGKRVWVFPKKPKGKYYKRRTLVSYFLIAFLFLLPIFNYIRVEAGYNPLFQFNVIERKFFIFGNYFQPQDFPILAIATIATIVFITVFTVIWGRLFCGWVCPQTIFLEMVFRKIEYAIDGDRNKQIKLAKQDWDSEKITKRTLKYSIYAVLSLLISIMFLSLIVGTHTVLKIFQEGIAENADTFIALLIFAGLFFFVFTWFREQACTLVCPYGRLQGVLVDKKTVTVSYDFKRGEGEKGRSKWRKGEDRKAAGKGDCIDCNQCVFVCPTGIDIRNGSNQLECVSCTACMDACDEIMEKIGFPTGLIKYASEENIEEGTSFKVSPRAWAYTAVITLLMGVLTAFMVNRTEVKTTLSRVPGANFIETDSTYSNPYHFILNNKTSDSLSVTLEMLRPKGARIYYGQDSLKIPPNGRVKGDLVIEMNKLLYEGSGKDIVIGVKDNKGSLLDKKSTGFTGPIRTF